jgi:succinoglycan biosynthesis protein ExoO
MVSILMVARDAAAFIDAAILSARDQSLSDLEIVVVDDGSRDATARIARSHADRDARVRVLEGPRRGLSAVRNASLDAARGRFAAIVDSDDLLHPRHLEGLVGGQARHGGAVCATNMLEFQGAGAAFTTRRFAQGPPWDAARRITPEEFVARGMIGGSGASLGYLKPLFDLAFLRANGLRYDERLRIGEDFDLVLRAMLAGARYVFLPQTTYYYRRHGGSTSHRLVRADLEGLLTATEAYRYAVGGAIAAQMHARRENLRGALLHLDTIAALKAGRPLQAWRSATAHREAARLTLGTLREAVAKRAGRAWPSRKTPAPVADECPAARLRAITQALNPGP